MKKLMSLLLVLAMSMSLCVGAASASGPSSEKDLERARLHNMVREQLIEQDSLYLMDFFDDIIEEGLTEKYDQISLLAGEKYFAPNGGWMSGVGTYIDVEAEFFDVADTKMLYSHRNDPLPEVEELMWDMLVEVAGDEYGAFLTAARMAEQAIKERQWSAVSIGNEGCYFYCVHDTLESKTTTVIMPWTLPYMSLGSSITVTHHYAK